MERDLSLPPEWVAILSEDNPPLSLMELSRTATWYDIYDALELVQYKTYLSIEEHNFNYEDTKGK